AETHCAISNTSLLLAREPHPDKKNFALEHCQPAPPVGKPALDVATTAGLRELALLPAGFSWPLLT
ncbi:hypothetical protein EFP16_13455, partial [Lactiplantibacillus pentosus]|nr:hypothetical protein [Lactiplantibacillus pentosus]